MLRLWPANKYPTMIYTHEGYMITCPSAKATQTSTVAQHTQYTVLVVQGTANAQGYALLLPATWLLATNCVLLANGGYWVLGPSQGVQIAQGVCR
jgi:hypothetical protein